MKITTKTGDNGETGLFRSGRVSKGSDIIDVLGEIDELQSFLGWCGVEMKNDPAVAKAILHIQDDLYRMMSIFGGAGGEIKDKDVEFLEKEMSQYKELIAGINAFIKPGANEISSRFHIARSVCRRVERKVVKYFEKEELNSEVGAIIKYLNRLSDLLFVWGVKYGI